MTSPVLHTENLTKFYGKKRGAIDVNIDVQEGEIFGYLGPNGAGKTTTIRMLMDFIRPSTGRAEIFSLDVNRDSLEIRRNVGYLSSEPALYGNMSGWDLITYSGNLRGSLDLAFVQDLAERLESDLRQPIKTLSHGSKQKVALIIAFMHKPALLMLDEPTQGLDPLVQQEFYRILLEAKVDGRTTFLSSHNLPEVERICDRVAIIRDGYVVEVESVEALKSRALRRLEIHFEDDGVDRTEEFSRLNGVRDVVVEGKILSCVVEGSLNTLIKTASKYEVANIVRLEPDLEEIFLTYYSGENNDAS